MSLYQVPVGGGRRLWDLGDSRFKACVRCVQLTFVRVIYGGRAMSVNLRSNIAPT